MSAPDVTAVRPFLPAKDFELSKRFYRALGFEILLDDVIAIFSCGGAGGFILQNYYVADWAENAVMQLIVDDLDAWWAHIEALDLPANFGVRPPKAPALQPWHMRVAYLIDPSGVLWHVGERREGLRQDGP
ncbi:VOC family protein [Phenylobacterium sp.]|jgi:catechol 2,3-dioxygenase-like lactoylglutathione lyase family enzyme|uniref:VOC family protein n=1 Tax=Phenylobacterium sp. TaxID=1871053 RepID=UPI002F3FEAE3